MNSSVVLPAGYHAWFAQWEVAEDYQWKIIKAQTTREIHVCDLEPCGWWGNTATNGYLTFKKHSLYDQLHHFHAWQIKGNDGSVGSWFMITSTDLSKL